MSGEEPPLIEALSRWADARDRRSLYGHGETGTALLREAIAALAAVPSVTPPDDHVAKLIAQAAAEIDAEDGGALPHARRCLAEASRLLAAAPSVTPLLEALEELAARLAEIESATFDLTPERELLKQAITLAAARRTAS